MKPEIYLKIQFMELLLQNTMLMNILFHLTKNKSWIITMYLSLMCLCCQEQNNINKNLEQAFKEYGYQDKAIIYREKNNQNIANSNKYIFLTAKELLKKLDENFFIISVSENKSTMNIKMYSFKEGKGMFCHFENNILKSTEIENIKIGESKPYYVYYEIIKRKHPKYMNWDLFPIPKDSLK